MATLHVKTPNGNQYNINLNDINKSGGVSEDNGYATLPNGYILQWGYCEISPEYSGDELWNDINYYIAMTTFWVRGCFIGPYTESSSDTVRTGNVRENPDSSSSAINQILTKRNYQAGVIRGCYWVAGGAEI